MRLRSLFAFIALALGLGPLPTWAQAQARAPQPNTLTQRLQACTVCHGKEGRATPEGYYPRIAGKPAGYLYNQLLNFRDGRRHNATMTYLVDHLSDTYLHEIARHYATLDLPYAPTPASNAPAEVLARGETLALKGDTTRQLPACVQCHGERLTGVQPAMPGLLGLPRDYLLAQLGAWRNHQRKATAPDCMATIAQRLDPQDMAAVVAWLAAQPMPADTKPAEVAPQAQVMNCGSGTR